jgi:hypothetical protein
MMAKCIRQLHVNPIEIEEDQSTVSGEPVLPLLHVYGPGRMISKQLDKWWLDYRRNAKVEDYSTHKCCAAHAIRFMFKCIHMFICVYMYV